VVVPLLRAVILPLWFTVAMRRFELLKNRTRSPSHLRTIFSVAVRPLFTFMERLFNETDEGSFDNVWIFLSPQMLHCCVSSPFSKIVGLMVITHSPKLCSVFGITVSCV
jgi:hypothetical protein